MAVAEEMFPKGLRVLVVDDNNTCLTILERLLQSCQYIVTITNEAIICLQMLRENCDNYDIVISDVHMPHMDGFALLQHIGLELDIPVVMLSANDDPKVVMRGVKHGAVDYLLKPVRIYELKNIWQHVVRRNQQRRLKGKAVCTGEGCPVRAALTDGNANANPEETLTKKRKDQINSEDGVGEVEGGGDEQEQEEGRRNDNLDLVSQKKPRVVWSPSLHKQFVIAVNSLGADKAYPKKILDLMSVEGLTRENVASHLQKYRLYLKRMNGGPGDPSSGILFGAQDSSIYLNGRSLLNPFGTLCSLGSGGLGKSATGVGGMLGPFPSAAYHSGLSQPASNLGKSLLQDQSLGSSRLINMSPLQNQNNGNRTSIDISSTGLQNNEVFGSQTSGMAAQQVVAPLSDYARRMENWQSSAIAHPTAQQNLLANNQLSSANFNNSYSSLDFSQLDLEGSYTNVSGTLGGPDAIVNGGGQGQDYLSVQTVGYNMAEPQNWQENMNAYTIIAGGYTNNPMVPAIGSSNPSFGEVISAEFNNNVDPIVGQVSGNTSGFMQFMEASDADGLDDNFLFEESELLAGFSHNDCGSLDDIIGELPK